MFYWTIDVSWEQWIFFVTMDVSGTVNVFWGQWMFFVTMDVSCDNGCFFLVTMDVSGTMGQRPTPTPTSTIDVF
jgi:hypothetical protein